MLVAFTMVNAELGYIEKSFTVFFILLTLINCGALLEQQRWVYQLEIVRLLTLAAYVSFAFESIWLFSLI